MEQIDLKEFFSYLKKYIFGFILAIILAVGGVALYDFGLKTPVYQANTTIVIAKSDSTTSSASTLNDVNASQKLTTTYSEIAKSELVLSRVISQLSLDMNVKQLSSNLTVKPVQDTTILSISVKDADAERAAVIANEIAEVFAEEVSKIYKLDNVSQLSVAKVPEGPSNNTVVRDMIIATIGAVVLVGGFALLRFYLNDTVKHTDDTEKVLGLPMTGCISKGDTKIRHGSADELVVANHPKAIVSENIKSLRTNLQFTAVDKNLKTILVTSANMSEGKSYVSSNLAVSFAQADKKVLLVDCDLRKGRLHKLFGLANKSGLSNLLAGDLNEVSKFIRVTKVPNLQVITCGTYPPNPSELLASLKNKTLIEFLRRYYDIIILDGAPVGGLADSVILSSYVDETIIVAKDGATSKSDLIAAKDALSRVGGKIAGIVFNMAGRKAKSYYNYYYGYGEESRKK